jgi:hypothetical protein
MLAVVALVASAIGAVAEPATQPVQLSERQSSILLQLSNAEANIKAINKALVRTGYKVGLAYEQKEGGEKANELMDRKGGGPVPWDQFYGKTAMNFYNRAELHEEVNIGRGAAVGQLDAHGSRLTRVERPAQFDFIYRANGNQVAQAQEQIASLLKDQAALLARRQKHETDQSALWAHFALEPVKDREIAFRPLYRFKLTPDNARAQLLRGLILFLRTSDKALDETLDTLDDNQGQAFAGLRQRMKDAYAALQLSVSNASTAAGVTDDDRKQIEALKDLCKRATEDCRIADENFRRAADSDQAHEDTSKLEYRAALQQSLGKIGTYLSVLDEQIDSVAAAWKLQPQIGVETPDAIPAARPVSMRAIAAPGVASASTTDTPAKDAQQTAAPAIENSRPASTDAETAWTVLFKSADPSVWNTSSDTANSFAIPLDRAPQNIRYLRIRNVGGDFVIIPLSQSELHSRVLHEHFAWDGALTNRCSALHLGIAQQSASRGRGGIDVFQKGGDGYTGWGFGNRVGMDDKQGYVWDGKAMKKTVFEIAVTAGQLTSDEQRRLLPE